MEIFRTDGGGRTENPLRLIRVIGMVTNRIKFNSSFWGNVVSVNDYKGDLTITLFKEYVNSLDETFVLYNFMREWENIGESSDNVYINYVGGNNE